MRSTVRVTAAALALLLAACATVDSRVGVSGVSDRLFCGRAIPGGGEISDADIETFINEIVEPRFPEGFTVWTAMGRWRGAEEKTTIIEIMHPYGSRFDDKVSEIAEEYRQRFQQEAVMRVTMPALMEFVEE